MSEPKVQCRACGAEILAATALRTDGLCMPCKHGGGSPEWRRRQLWFQCGADASAGIPWYRSPWGGEIITICKGLVSGELDCAQGASKMAAYSEIVLDAAHGDKWLHEDWAAFFRIIDSERVRTAASKLLKEAAEATMPE
ncbi:MAG: hypothetical protein EBS05_22695 [Proteobacteria bacterium]|nr:hypothetical protein [Pseudomonadota bacterium]